MTKTDSRGRPYVLLAGLRDGDEVWIDGGFPCARPGKKVVWVDACGPYFSCSGPNDEEASSSCRHYLDGQADDGVSCVGVYPADPGPVRWGYGS